MGLVVRAGVSWWLRGCWPEPFLWCYPFSFLCGVTFSNVGIDFWEWQPKLAGWCWDYWSHLVFHFQESFHLFDNGGCGWSFVVHGMHLISWVIQSLLKMCVPYIDVTLTSMSTTSTGSLHIKYLCRKLHSGWSRQAISKIKNVP